MNICVIPARGGSKRIPYKNIREFCGKPMIAWSIEAAIESGCFERIICSTDNEDIAAVAREYNAETPFLRPKILSDDYSTITPVISHAINSLQTDGKNIDSVCCIYATAPFIQSKDIINSLKQMIVDGADYCFSVTNYPYPIQRSIRITEENRCEMLYPEKYNSRSQDLEEMYHDAGQFYWGKSDAWLKQRNLFSKHSSPYVLPRYRVQDIDTKEDWRKAELMHLALL
jgi:pseudaminic acid cytidylyltransferase